MKSWRVQTCNLQECGEKIGLRQLKNFVDRQARILNQPIFGELNNRTRQLEKSSRSFATNKLEIGKTEKEDFLCFCCKKRGSHILDDCFFFKRKTYDEKKKFIR